MEDKPTSIPCKCKYSKCLKLYCECFSNGEYCKGCDCTNCHNLPEKEAIRSQKIQTILKRNPLAFRPKIPIDPFTAQPKPADHFQGCICKKTKCKKKYCECFNAGIECTDLCRCSHCKNKQEPKIKAESSLNNYFRVLVEGWNRCKDYDGRSEGSTSTIDDSDNYEKFERDFYEGLCKLLRNNVE